MFHPIALVLILLIPSAHQALITQNQQDHRQ